MKTICNNLDCKINQTVFFGHSKNADEHILELQDIFLEPGIHYLSTPSFAQGRQVIFNYLKALRCFNAPACFSLQQGEFGAANLADYIAAMQLASFFELEFDADFLWVECDKTLLEYYPTLLMNLERVTARQHISILILIIR